MSSVKIFAATPTIFGIRIVDAPARPSYKPQYKPNLLDSVTGLKAGALRTGANALRFKVPRRGENICIMRPKYFQGDQFYNGAQLLDSTANGFSPAPQSSQLNQLRAPRPGQSSAQLNFLNTVNR